METKMKIILGQCKRHSRLVAEADLPLIKSIAKRMAALCVDGEGFYRNAYAIAHCQVDHADPMRFFVFADGTVVINPKILSSDFPFWHREGCMSYPFRGMVKLRRFGSATVEWFDLGFGRRVEELKHKGVRAAVFQHEIDHMDGISIHD